MYKEYKSIPQTRMACQMQEGGTITKVKAGIYSYKRKGSGGMMELVEFGVNVKQPEPKLGDYIVKLKADDIYLVEKEQFEKTYNPVGFKLM